MNGEVTREGISEQELVYCIPSCRCPTSKEAIAVADWIRSAFFGNLIFEFWISTSAQLSVGGCSLHRSELCATVTNGTRYVVTYHQDRTGTWYVCWVFFVG